MIYLIHKLSPLIFLFQKNLAQHPFHEPNTFGLIYLKFQKKNHKIVFSSKNNKKTNKSQTNKKQVKKGKEKLFQHVTTKKSEKITRRKKDKKTRKRNVL